MIQTIYNENLYKRIIKMNKILFAFVILFTVTNCRRLLFLQNSSESYLTNAITDTYKQLLSSLKTYQDVPMYSTLIKNSFREFAASARSKVIWKVKAEMFENAFRKILHSHKIKENFIDEIIPSISEVEFFDESVWSWYDMFYNPIGKEEDKVKYLSLFINHYEKEYYEAVIVNIELPIKMAPNVEIIRQSKSVDGGIFKKDKQLMYKKIHGFLSKEGHLLYHFFSIIALQSAARQFGKNLELPRY